MNDIDKPLAKLTKEGEIEPKLKKKLEMKREL
jgi:hypothetical protein